MIADATEVIGRRFGASRPGMTLVAVTDAAIPVTVVKAEVLAQERKGLPLIEEFILRFLFSGVDDVDELAALLGLEREEVLTAVAMQISHGSVDHRADGHLALTQVGQELARDHEAVQPVYDEVEVVFDRLAWEPTAFKKRDLVRRTEAEERGWLVLPPFRSARMALDDIPVADLNSIVHGSSRKTRLVEILRVRKITAQNLHRFLPVKLLIYSDQVQGDITLDVYVGGSVLPAHGSNLASIDAVSDLPFKVEAPAEMPKLPAEVAALAESSESEPAEAGEATPLVRPVSVFEHPDLLREALSSASSRLLIISPWLKAPVVNANFIALLEQRLRSKVAVHIGFGIGRDDDDSHQSVIRRLSNLAKQHPNFRFSRLPNTHAKILIFDNTLIATSFNWLSFAGAENRTYRQEQGLLVSDPAVVDSQYQEFVAAIAAGDSR